MYSLDKTIWYLNRLKSMSLAEIAYRARSRFLVTRERLSVSRSLGSRYLHRNSQDISAQGVSSSSVSWLDPVVSGKPGNSILPADFLATRRLADDLLRHKVELFGDRFELGSDIHWSRDPRTTKEWPMDFWAQIDTRDGKSVGGIKWIWELNRHHHLVTLSKAYYLFQEEKYAEEVCQQLTDWILSSPPLMGVNWTSSLELAVRLINWTWILAFLRDSRALTRERLGLILDSIADQGVYIRRHTSAYSSANNHLIGEAAGLAIVGIFIPGLPDADRWRETGLKILERELERQIYPDGVPAEQAFSYLSFVLDFNLLAWRLTELNGYDVPEIWYERLAAACEFINHIMDDRGNVPAVGDGDDALVVRLDDRPDANNFRSILATAAVLLKRPEFKRSAGRWDEKSHWLLGEAGHAVFESLDTAAVQPVLSRAFRDGGYCVMRAPGRVLTFDCGPLGYLSTAAHGHADALSLTLSKDGQPILIDPGTYAYQEGGPWRDYFRSTAAHNTIVVDGQNQSEIKGTFLWGRKAKSRLTKWKTTPDYDLAVGEHDGYSAFGVKHRRSVLFSKPDLFVIVDTLYGEGEHQIEQHWHLPVGTGIELDGQRAFMSLGKHQWQIAPFQENTIWTQAAIFCGVDSPIQGWISQNYGWKEPAHVLYYSARLDFPVRAVTAIALEGGHSALEKDGWQARMTRLLADIED